MRLADFLQGVFDHGSCEVKSILRIDTGLCTDIVLLIVVLPTTVTTALDILFDITSWIIIILLLVTSVINIFCINAMSIVATVAN